MIENRLESEESTLEHHLLGRRGSSGEGEDSRRAPAPQFVSGPSTLQPTAEKSRPSLSNKHVPSLEFSVPHDELPLSHTWHGGGSRQLGNTGDGDQMERPSTGVAQNGRTAVRPSTKIWGASRVSRELEVDSNTPTGTDAASAGTGRGGTPNKSVKFQLGRRRTNSQAATESRGTVESDRASLGAGVGLTAISGEARSSVHEDGKEAADLQGLVMNVTVQTTLWADYFNNILRCWEALLDPFR